MLVRKTLKRLKSFTLVETMVTVGIVAAMSLVVVLVVNPVEIFASPRDSKRAKEINMLDTALELAAQANVDLGSSNTVYISAPDTSPTCANLSLPELESGWVYSCRPEATYRNVDGTGWLPVDFTKLATGQPFPVLPLDPENSADDTYYYSYITDGSEWLVATLLESNKQLKKLATSDGGSDPIRFERGNLPAKWREANKLIGYWPFDESSGDVIHDASGDNDAVLISHGGSISWLPDGGQVNGAAEFTGEDGGAVGKTDWQKTPSGVINGHAFSFWIKLNPALGIAGQGYPLFRPVEDADRISLDYRYLYGALLIWEMPPLRGMVGESSRINHVFGQLQASPGTPFSQDLVLYLDDDEWKHVVMTLDGMDLRAYVNGEPADILSSYVGGGYEGWVRDLDTTEERTLYIGGGYDIVTSGGEFVWFNGILDELVVYHRAISENEAKALYKSGL